MVPLFKIFKKKQENENKVEEGEYIEVPPTPVSEEAKVYIKVFEIRDFSDVKEIVDALREGNIVFVDIRGLRSEDLKIDRKKVILRIKNTVEAINGDIVLVGNEWLIATPSFARIYRNREEKKEESK